MTLDGARIDRIIGLYATCIGFSVRFNSASVLRALMVATGGADIASLLFVSLGMTIVACSFYAERPLRLALMCIAFVAMLIVGAAYLAARQPTPIALFNVVILLHILERMVRLWPRS